MHTALLALSCRSVAMRDWILLSVPVAAAIYFLVYPDQFRELFAWITALVQ